MSIRLNLKGMNTVAVWQIRLLGSAAFWK